MTALLEDINQEFHMGNMFTLNVASELCQLLDSKYRVIVKYDNQELPIYDDGRFNVVISTSRETHDYPHEFFRDDVLVIFQHYYMLDQWDHPWYNPLVYPLPIGTFVEGFDTKFIKPMAERKYDFSFIGQIPHTGTRDCFKRHLDELMETSGDKFKYFVQYTDGFKQGLDTSEYLDLLGDTKICLCPQGAYSSETFRFFEAILMGAIPMVENLPKLWYYENAPFIKSKWIKLEKSLCLFLNALQTEKSRNILYRVAQYAQTVLNPKSLANSLKEKIDIRHQKEAASRSYLENVRKTIQEVKL